MRSDFTIYNLDTGIPLKTGHADVELQEIPTGYGVALERINLESQRIDPVTKQVVDREPENG